jgi:hypothetical protein
MSNETKLDHETETQLLEVRKLLNILQTWGNILVPSIEGKETYASERLQYVVDKLLAKGMTMDEISAYVDQAKPQSK